ncbi:MAG TPA: amino acid ABC transporter permease [Lichenihabitans sp.]|jgi:polar amino acid transport system permease protein/cystine transport system permease protein|nr:amino acid ABC transporter permease [Lichenihabitans sp.]
MTAWARALPLIPSILAALLKAAVTTLEITAGALAIALILGLVVAFMRRSRSALAVLAAETYVQVFRCIPVLTQLFIIYFGLGEFGLRLSPLTAAIIGFGLNGTAYLAEIYRSGIDAVHKGQAEAALAIGMTRPQAMWWIVLPQAIRTSLPPIGNYGIGLLKDSSIAMAIAAPEITFQATAIINQTYLSTQVYLIMTAIYLAMSLPLSHAVRLLEARTGRGR